MPRTLALDDNWDITLDEMGNIAVYDDDYAIAQNVANAVRLFTNDAYFNKTRGIPHYDVELGNPAFPSRSVLYARIRQAAMNVSGVTDAEVTLDFDKSTRTYKGDIYITTKNSTQVRIEL